MTLRRTAACSALGLLALSTLPAAQDASERARQLFLTNCATCHGETGDGKGVTQLDRPARSFMDGGFSFGNTPEALFRTISVGIPGTPMPGFDSSLSEEDRHVLASYVVTLGPPVEVVKDEDMILAVHDRPLIVRGLLPSLGEGLPTHPRGLLIGDPTGITFEYRVDDVRLLALRQGGFVKRTDWTGRGGTALEPLGKVVHLVEGGKPDAMFWPQGDVPLARLSSTRVGPNASLSYHLVQNGREIAHVEETPRVLTTAFGTGYERRFQFQAIKERFDVRSPAVRLGRVVAEGVSGPRGQDHEQFYVVRTEENLHVFMSLGPTVEPSASAFGNPPHRPGDFRVRAHVSRGSPQEIVLRVLFLTDFNEGILSQLEAWRKERK